MAGPLGRAESAIRSRCRSCHQGPSSEVCRAECQRIRLSQDSLYGPQGFEQKLQNLLAIGSAPFSLVAFHNAFFRQALAAFVMGCYPSLTSVGALGERVLNHLVLTLRDEYSGTAEFRRVRGKKSFDNWDVAIDALAAWGALLPEAANQFRRLRSVQDGVLITGADNPGRHPPRAPACLVACRPSSTALTMPAAMDIAAATHLTFILCAPPCDDEPALLARVVRTMRPYFPGAAERALPPDSDERFQLRLVAHDDVVAFEGGSALPAAGSPAVVTLGPRGSDWRTHEGEPQDIEVLVMAPATPGLVEAAPRILGELAATASARWGFADVSGVDDPPRSADEHEKLGLPELHVDLMDGVAPMALGWLNFWSAAACERLGVPASGPALDPQGQQHAQQVAGGWLMSLTREPLDLHNEQHLASLRRAYDRFPEVGGVAEHPRHEQRLRTDPRAALRRECRGSRPVAPLGDQRGAAAPSASAGRHRPADRGDQHRAQGQMGRSAGAMEHACHGEVPAQHACPCRRPGLGDLPWRVHGRAPGRA